MSRFSARSLSIRSRLSKPTIGVLAGAVCAIAITALVASRNVAANPRKSAGLIVHEWGTFLSAQGSDGTMLDGMYHEEHELPGFVHARSRDQLHLPTAFVKGETPVIYFYSNQRQPVRVTVGFPTGIWTQWYPQATMIRPGLATATAPASIGVPRDGQIFWDVEIVPPDAGKAPPLPKTKDGALWNFTREVDASYVRALDYTHKDKERPEWERFLFYRGLGQGPLPLVATSTSGGTLSISGPLAAPLRHLFVVRIENGKGAFNYLPKLAANETLTGVVPSLSDARPVAQLARELADQLAEKLVEAGLYDKEARAMVNTWEKSYFHSDGLRVLYLLPQAWTDQYIPMTVGPAPSAIVRVMVGRLEMLTPEREKLIADSVNNLASTDSGLRDLAFGVLKNQGRLAEPAIRRVMATTNDEQTRALCQRLLLTDFVTELRAAVSAPLDGTRVHENPNDVRAQLALLLHEAGQTTEAKFEAKRVLAELSKAPELGLDNHEARHPLRSYARAYEAMGLDAKASESYAKFIRFASQVKTKKACTGCHSGHDGPRHAGWLDDWWAGRRYANLQRKLGQAPKTISALEDTLKREPNDAASQLMLSYLKQPGANTVAGQSSRGR